MKKHSLLGEKLLKRARARAHQRYYLWIIACPEVRASLQICPLKFKIQK